jgi:predicted RNA binding protein YcfA (HicA-like mRNA interferase family)
MFSSSADSAGTPILLDMTRRLNNWRYRDVVSFLKENGFELIQELRGSHELWGKPGNSGEKLIIVNVNFTHGSYPPKTLKTMIRQSGLHQRDWLDWARS